MQASDRLQSFFSQNFFDSFDDQRLVIGRQLQIYEQIADQILNKLHKLHACWFLRKSKLGSIWSTTKN